MIYMSVTGQRTTSLFLFVNNQLCYSRQNKDFSIHSLSLLCSVTCIIHWRKSLFNAEWRHISSFYNRVNPATSGYYLQEAINFLYWRHGPNGSLSSFFDSLPLKSSYKQIYLKEDIGGFILLTTNSFHFDTPFYYYIRHIKAHSVRMP